MELAKPQQYRARVSEQYYLSDNKHYLLTKLELVTPDRLTFLAGQYVSLKIDERGVRRSYSIASTPDDNHGVTLIAEMLPNGAGSQYLAAREPGDSVEILAPLGRFVVQDTGRHKLLFVATGSGIAPVYSMINDLLINKHGTRQIRLHWGMKNEASLFWFDNFERLAEEHSNFIFDPVLSEPAEDWDLCTGHVQDCLQRDFGTKPRELAAWQGYVCGNPTMVENVSELLQKLGMQPAHIYHEKFT